MVTASQLINKLIGVYGSCPEVGFCAKIVKEEPNLEEQVVRSEMKCDTTHKHTHSHTTMCSVMPCPQCVRGLLAKGDCKMGFHLVWSTGLSL